MNDVITLIDNLLIQYFQGSLKPSIRAELNKKDWNLDNSQVIVKQAVDTKAKAAWHISLLAQKSDACCFCGYKPLKYKKPINKKNSKAKKNHSLTMKSNSGKSG